MYFSDDNESMDEHADVTYMCAYSRWFPDKNIHGMVRQFRMGSSVIPKLGIYPCMLGVVGPFVKMNERCYFVTASHVVCQRLNYQNIVNDANVLQLYRSGSRLEGRSIGNVETKGTSDKPTMVALIQINQSIMEEVDSYMKGGRFIFAGISPINFPYYDNRNSWEETQVYVFGNQTRTAKAKIMLDKKRGLIRLRTPEYGLIKQEEGGAAVFIADEDDMLHCVGMYVCHFEDDNRHFLLVSIETILETFGAGLQQTLEIVSFVSAEKDSFSTTSLDEYRAETNADDYARSWLESNDTDPESSKSSCEDTLPV
ncbi:uncharacterized protein LOC132738577 isoform X2 [Ruditapes philippinarum]|uniref:uncharacterized protein LOC132738577 isoform X2 n=1 Tax=Ruditapes philippinarum TaxID=129788 RepID=UPI00295AB5E4|nr:uncharacterized protein LOC132738577 isoform X2 [Ruditapes philippinarum]